MGKRKSGRGKEVGIWGRKNQGKLRTIESFKRCGEYKVPQLDSYNKFNILATEINVDTLKSERNKKVEVRKMKGKMLREVTVKIGLERIDMQEGIMVEVLLDSGATGLVMSSEFARK